MRFKMAFDGWGNTQTEYRFREIVYFFCLNVIQGYFKSHFDSFEKIKAFLYLLDGKLVLLYLIA